MNKQIMILIASCLLTFSHFCFSMECGDDSTSSNAIVRYSNNNQRSPVRRNPPSNNITTQPNTSTTQQRRDAPTTSREIVSTAKPKRPKKNLIVLEEESEEKVADNEIEATDFTNWPCKNEEQKKALAEALVKLFLNHLQKNKVQNTELSVALYKKENKEEEAEEEKEPNSPELQLDLFKRPWPLRIPFRRPVSMQLLHSYAQVIFVPENAYVAGIGAAAGATVGVAGSLLTIVYSRLKGIGVKVQLIGGMLVAFAAAGAIIYTTLKSYQNYKNQGLILGLPDVKYKEEIEKLLKNPTIHPLTLLSRYFNIQTLAHGTKIDTTYETLKNLLTLMRFGTIAVESSPTAITLTLYTGADQSHGYTINSLDAIHQFIDDCTEITCSGNRTFGFINELEIPKEIRLLTNLQKLIARQAGSAKINISDFPHPPTLVNLTHLEITDSPDSMTNFVKRLYNNALLEILILRSNRITNTKLSIDSFSQLPSLQQLDLSHNELIEVPDPVSTLIRLTDLDMSYNQLTDVEKKIIAPLTNARLNFENNPINSNTMDFIHNLSRRNTQT